MQQPEHFLLLLAPFAPHLAEELWMTVLKKKKSVHLQSWPEYNAKLLVQDTVQMPVQINGKVRDVISVAANIREDDAVFAARKSENVARYLEGATVRKVIFIPGKLLNLVLE